MAHIEQSRAGSVLTLTFNRPDKKNALTNAMYGVIADALEAAQHDTSVRCVLMTGAGDVFTSGNDLADFAAFATGKLAQADMHVYRFLNTLATFDKPLIAAVPGLAVGVGTTLLLHCDLVFLSESATLSTPFADLALVPEAASSLLLQSRIGYVRAFSMFALGERIDARTALAWGLANKITPADALRDHATAAAAMLAAKPPGALMATKRLMRDTAVIAARMTDETGVFSERLKSPEAREAFMAFAERRAPDFSRF